MKSIRIQLILFAVSLVVLVGGSIAAYSIYQKQKGLLATFRLEALTNVATLSSVIADDLYQLNISSLRNIIKSIRANSDVRLAFIADDSQLILTDGTRDNQDANKPLSNFIDSKLLNSDKLASDHQKDVMTIAGPVYSADKTLLGYIAVAYSLEKAWRISNQTTLASLIITAVCLLIGVILSIRFANRLSQPILEVVKMAGKIGSGDFSERLEVERKDEIQELASSINRMAENLEDHTNKLQVALVKAEEGSRAKSEFLATMSHEIRTPLNGITSLAELLLFSELDEQQQEDVKAIQSSVDSLRQIISDILDFSKIEAGQLKIDFVDFNLLENIATVSKPFSAICQQQEIELVIELDPKLPEQVTADSLRLEQILRNLLSNATKFSKKHGAVILYAFVEEVYPERVDVHFAVADTGIGIPKDKADQIFESFAQADSSTSREYGGTGLGLSICQRLLEMMGGSIWFNSKAGVGSAFHFILPVALSKKTAIKATDKINVDEPKQDKRRRVLLVEDNTLNQTTIKRILETKGFRVNVAGDGNEALDTLEHEIFDLILMDLHLPGMDGIETTKLIRSSHHPFAQTPIIALTAHAIRGVKESCLAVDMNGFVAKPIDYEELFSIISQVCSEYTPHT